MTYYIQCPKCGDIIETTNFLPEDHVCYGCGHHYKITRKNSMKKPSVCVFVIASFAMLMISLNITGCVFNYGAGRENLWDAAWFALGGGIMAYGAVWLQNKIERSIKRYGVERVRKSIQITRKCNRD